MYFIALYFQLIIQEVDGIDYSGFISPVSMYEASNRQAKKVYPMSTYKTHPYQHITLLKTPWNEKYIFPF